MLTALSTGVLAVSLATAAAVPPGSAVPPPGDAVVRGTAFEGSGCPKDLTTLSESPDGHAVTLGFSVFQLLVSGAGVKSLDCTLTARITPPAGYRAALAGSTVRGTARLTAGAAADVRVTFRTAGSPIVVRSEHLVTGPVDDYWDHNPAVADGSLVYGGCGEPRDVTIKTELTALPGGPGRSAYAAVDTVDLGTNQFAWERCAG
jgi:hypothetical protein